MAHWLVSIFITTVFVKDHVWHPFVIAGKTHWLKTLLFSFMGRCLARKISLYFPKTLHPAFILMKTSFIVLFSIAFVCPWYLWLVAFSISVLSICTFSVVSVYYLSLIWLFHIYIFRPIFKLSSFTVFNWCSISLTPSVVRTTSLANLLFDSFFPSIFTPFSSSWAFWKTFWIVAVNSSGEIGPPCLTPLNIGIFSETWLSISTFAVAPV